MSLAKKKRLLNLRESICINTVVGSYQRVIRESFNQRVFTNAVPGSKTANNCKKFVELANNVGKSPYRLLKEALAFFDSDFCRRTTGRDYPQITFLISEKTQGRLITQNKPMVKVTKSNFESIANQYWHVLKTMDKDLAVSSVKAGWPDGAPEVRKVLLRRLKNGS